MNYLAFQPAFDVFHTQFRFLRLRRVIGAERPWLFDQLRLADFYLLFFFRLQGVRLSPRHKSLKKLAQQLSKGRYEKQPEDHLLFGRMKEIQVAAFNTLVANGFFDADAFNKGFVIESSRSESRTLSERVDSANQRDADVLEAIESLISDYDWFGPDGLKARTGLLEFRYDAV